MNELLNKNEQVPVPCSVPCSDILSPPSPHGANFQGARVLVGMSGGVDSSVAAALLVEAGCQVTGAYMKNWTLDVPGMQCPWAEDLVYAKRTAVKLGIDLRVYDFQEAYKRDVVDYLVAEYEAGRTPNPDVMCNQDIKFGLFMDTALAEGFDYIATGHYARSSAVLTNGGMGDSAVSSANDNPSPVRLEEPSQAFRQPAPEVLLLQAKDEHKDQTYFLYRMGQKALAHTLFPLGGYTKQEVRKMAEARSLPAANKPDSQGICFIGEAPIQDFLRLYVHPQPGKIIDADTHEVVGGHDGALFFTLGQRKGLGVGGGAPYYVVGKNMDANEVYVSHSPQALQLQTSELALTDCTWLAGVAPAAGTYLVRTRHTGPLVPCEFTPDEKTAAGAGAAPVQSPSQGTKAHTNTSALLRFSTPQERVAPGQSAVLYSGDVCLGGGIVQ